MTRMRASGVMLAAAAALAAVGAEGDEVAAAAGSVVSPESEARREPGREVWCKREWEREREVQYRNA